MVDESKRLDVKPNYYKKKKWQILAMINLQQKPLFVAQINSM
jgi:hypothetical protein